MLDLVHLKKDHRDESVYQQLFMKIRDRYRDYRWFTGWELYMACAAIFPSDTVISMRLPDSASIFTAQVWAFIKALEQIKDSVASKCIIFTDSLACLNA